MSKKALALLVYVLAAILAGCLEVPTQPVSAPAGTATAGQRATQTGTPTATPRPTAQVVAEALRVYDANGIVRHWLTQGDIVTVLGCGKDNLCKISTDVLTGYVFRGCLSGNDDLGCRAK